MRTTVVLNDRLFVEARRLAAERGISMSTLVSEALRQRLSTKTTVSETRFRMPVYGSDRIVDTTPEEIARVGEDDDLNRNDS